MNQKASEPTDQPRSITFTKRCAGDLQRIRDLTKSKLEDLGYQTVMVDSWRSEASTTNPDLAQMNDAALCRLAPEDAPIFMVITIENVDDTYSGITASYSISATFDLVDRAKGASIWKERGKGSHGAGGIIGSAIATADKRTDAQTGFVNVLSDMPQNKK